MCRKRRLKVMLCFFSLRETKTAADSLKFYNIHREHLEAPTSQPPSYLSSTISLSLSLTFEVDNIHAVKSIKPVLTQNIIYIVG